jgi:hypothetical protein
LDIRRRTRVDQPAQYETLSFYIPNQRYDD